MLKVSTRLPDQVTVWKSLGVHGDFPPRGEIFLQAPCMILMDDRPDPDSTAKAGELNKKWHRVKCPWSPTRSVKTIGLWTGATEGPEATNMTHHWHMRFWVPLLLGRRWRRISRRKILTRRLLLCAQASAVELPPELVSRIILKL